MFSSSLGKSKNGKKSGLGNKQTAAWVDSVASTITISDSSDDDDNDSTAVDKQTNDAVDTKQAMAVDVEQPAMAVENAQKPKALMENTEKFAAMEIQPGTGVESEFPALGLPHAANVSADISYPTAEGMDTDEIAEEPGLVGPSAASPLVNIPDDSRPAVSDANGRSSAVEEDQVFINGLLSSYIVSWLFSATEIACNVSSME